MSTQGKVRALSLTPLVYLPPLAFLFSRFPPRSRKAPLLLRSWVSVGRGWWYLRRRMCLRQRSHRLSKHFWWKPGCQPRSLWNQLRNLQARLWNRQRHAIMGTRRWVRQRQELSFFWTLIFHFHQPDHSCLSFLSPTFRIPLLDPERELLSSTSRSRHGPSSLLLPLALSWRLQLAAQH